MTDPTNDFSHPATKVADYMAVTGSLPGVFPVLELPRVEVFGCCRAGLFVRFFSLAQYARARSTLDGADIFDVRVFGSLVSNAAVSRGPACGDTTPAAGGDFSAAPHGNNGDNQTNPTDKAVL